MQELPILHSARRLMLIDICMKFREDSPRGFQVTERTRLVTDRQTDRQTDRRPGKNNMSPNPEGGRHNLRKTTIYNTNIDLVYNDVYTKFGLILSIRSQNIE